MVITAVGVMLVAANLRPPVVSVAPVIDVISDDRGFSSATAGLLTTLPVLFFGLSALVAPRIAARLGIERTIFGALLLLIAAIALRLVPTDVALFVGSALLGVAIGICNVVLPALIKRDFAESSGLMTGLYSMTLSGGAAVAAGITVPIDEALDHNWRVTLALWGLVAAVAALCWLPQLGRVNTIKPGPRIPGLFRDPLAWAITAYMASQSLIFFTFTAWLPAYLIDEGWSPTQAGGALAFGQVAALVSSLVAPIIAGRSRDQRPVTLAFIVLCAVGFAGLILTDRWVLLWTAAVMMGPGAAIGLALLFMVLRSNSPVQTGQVSGMAQSMGYILAAVGPFLMGGLHDVTGSWTVAMVAVSLALIPQASAAWFAARPGRMRDGTEGRVQRVR